MLLDTAKRDEMPTNRQRSGRAPLVVTAAVLVDVAVGALVAVGVGPRSGLVAAVGTGALIGAVAVVQRLQVRAVDLLTVYLAALLLIPGYHVLPMLGGVGAPANVIGLLCGIWWALDRIHGGYHPESQRRYRNPVAIAVWLYLAVSAVAFVTAFSRPLTQLESAGAAQAMVGLLSLVGVTLLVLWGIRTRDDLERLLRRLMILAAGFALIAVVQFFTSFDPVTRIRLPFLELNGAWQSVAERSGLPRVASSALHAIEFGAVLAMLIPLALHRAWYSEPERRTENWLIAGILAFALPLSISRTAVLALAIALLVMFPAWTWSRRIKVAAGAAMVTVIMRLIQPGLIGTIIALFTRAADDPSTKGRTADYAQIGEFVSQNPWLGRGLGTFSPLQYFFLDNMVLMALITGGVLGLLGLLALVGTSITTARQVYWHGSDPRSWDLGATLAACIAGAFVSMLTFDALGFPIFAGLFFLLCAVSGVLWEIDVAPRGRLYTNPRARRRGPR